MVGVDIIIVTVFIMTSPSLLRVCEGTGNGVWGTGLRNLNYPLNLVSEPRFGALGLSHS